MSDLLKFTEMIAGEINKLASRIDECATSMGQMSEKMDSELSAISAKLHEVEASNQATGGYAKSVRDELTAACQLLHDKVKLHQADASKSIDGMGGRIEALFAEVETTLAEGVAEDIASLQVEVEQLKGMDVNVVAAKAADLIPAPKDGKDGEDGKDGADGQDGKDGTDGKDGQDGEDGQPGADGKDGKDGQDGKSGADLEILPAIDPDKSYPRGTYAAHAGGLFKAYQQTVGMIGWECVVRGVHGVTASLSDDYTLSVGVAMSDGMEVETSKSLPVLEYKDVYKVGNDYIKGNCVTYGGSLWIALVDNPVGTPSQSEDWRLAVKKGSDLRDPKRKPESGKGVKL